MCVTQSYKVEADTAEILTAALHTIASHKLNVRKAMSAAIRTAQELTLMIWYKILVCPR